MIREFYLSIKRNLIINLILTSLSSLSLLLLFTILLFNRRVNENFSLIENIYENTEIYLLSDTVDTQSFLSEDDALDRVKAFYDELLNTQAFQFITVGGQPLEIAVDDFQGDNSFQEGYEFNTHLGPIDMPGEGHVYQIRALQLNQLAFDLFELQINQGRRLEATDFESFSGLIPVLLGHHYLGIYEIGDRIEAHYGFESFEFEVVGILEANQTIFNYRADFFVDNYILMPNMDFGDPQDEEQELAQIFRYLRRLYGFIFIENTPEAFDEMVNTIEVFSTVYRIPTMIFGMDEGVVNYNEIRNLTHHNRDIIRTLFIASMGLITSIILILARIKYSRRQSVYEINRLMGTPLYQQLSILGIETMLIYFISVVAAVYYVMFHTTLLIDIEWLLEMYEIHTMDGIQFPLYNIIISSLLHSSESRAVIGYGAILLFITMLYPLKKLKALYR